MQFLLIVLLFNQSFSGRVVSVTDGDTLGILHDNVEKKVRLADIDAPEKNQAFGSRSKIILSEKVFGKTVKVNIHDKDRYGRYVGTVIINNKNINLEMVKEGYAWWYRQYSKNYEFGQAEIEAKKNKEGLWVDPFAIPPWEFRGNKTTKPLTNTKKKSGKK
jgi:endonuclease YncB( thermonuclease family)